MAFDFPASPTVGQTFTSGLILYTWDGEKWVAGQLPGMGAAIEVGDTPPPAPADKTLWYESDSGGLYLRLNDGSSTQWVQVNGAMDVSNLVKRTGDTMSGNLAINAVSSSLSLNKLASGEASNIFGNKVGVQRWLIQLGDSSPESGSNAGSDFALHNYTDAGAWLSSPLTIKRSNGAISVSHIIQFMGPSVPGYYAQGTPTSWNFATNLAGSAGMYMVPGGAAWVAFSDARLPHKIDATPVNDVLARLDGVHLYTNETPGGHVELFVKAQELYESLPELVVPGTGPAAHDANLKLETVPQLGDPNIWGVVYERAGVVALQAIKELKAQVDALHARITELEAGDGV